MDALGIGPAAPRKEGGWSKRLSLRRPNEGGSSVVANAANRGHCPRRYVDPAGPDRRVALACSALISWRGSPASSTPRAYLRLDRPRLVVPRRRPRASSRTTIFATGPTACEPEESIGYLILARGHATPSRPAPNTARIGFSATQESERMSRDHPLPRTQPPKSSSPAGEPIS
jgi:hypothetical protein